jgi:UDP-N-acetylmuramoyl-tripeptide--D-alanyl-D-alanine ligase
MTIVRSVNSLKSMRRRLKRWLAEGVREPVKFELARGYRSVLDRAWNVRFIAVTGSCGKTTTTELAAAALAHEGRVYKCSHANSTRALATAVLCFSPRHRFGVLEVSASESGAIERSIRLLHPRIVIVTNIGQDHYASFRTLEATAAEKGRLVAALPADGVAVLNADDPHVYEMRRRTRAQVITYGLSAEATVRGENVSCAWPDPMSMDVLHLDKRFKLQTRLLGEHWAYAVLAALSTAVAAGVPLECALPAVATCNPTSYRLSPHPLPGGITVISDTWKAALWTVPASLRFLKTARAPRKIVVFGSLSDTPKSFYHRYKAVVPQALDVADKIFFVGQHARTALRVRRRPDDDRVMAFDTLYHLHSFLTGYLQAGDLVLLKGSEPADHLHRLILARSGGIACWRERCSRNRYCNGCRHLQTPAGPTGT